MNISVGTQVRVETDSQYGVTTSLIIWYGRTQALVSGGFQDKMTMYVPLAVILL